MSRTSFWLALLPVTLLSSVALADDAKREQITIAEYGEYPLYTILYIADAKGYFTAEGLDAKIVPAGGDEKVFAALVSGDAQFGVSDPTFTAISGQRGKPGKVVAAVLQNIPAWGVAKDPKIPAITKPTDLKGLRVATFPAPSTSFTLQKRMFLQAGLDPNITEIAYGALLPALEAGRIDIALENEPNVSLAESKGAHRVYSLSTYYPDFAFTGLMVLPDYMEAHPQTVQKVVNAFQRAMNSLHSDLPGAVDIIDKRFPSLTKPVIEKALKNSLASHTFPTNGLVNKRGWEAAINMRREVGDLKIAAPYEQYVEPKFAEAAKTIR